jgi:hypothetical protein
MKTQQLVIAAITAAVAMNSCTTEEYYRSANRSAELRTSINLDAIDTIKTSAVSRQRTFLLPIEATDENGNMNLLTTFADGGETRILDGLGEGATENIELAKDRYAFMRQIEFIPTSDGRHTINVRVRDDFGNVTSMEKSVYSFTNMRPKLKIVYYAERYSPDGIYHHFDFNTSYDRDSKWGGTIDSLFFLAKAMNYINSPDYEEGNGVIDEAMKVSDPSGEDHGVHVSPYEMLGDWWDDGTEWYSDVWVWVKDNENMPSDTIHIHFGHIENNVPRKEYEGR